MFRLEEGQHRFTEIQVLDEPGAGGAYHEYRVVDSSGDDQKPCHEYAYVRFQKGPIKEAGKNGIFIEDLLQICRHRLQCFPAGGFACRENALALTKIEEALHWLDHRTRDRQARGVEGKSEK